MYLFIFETKLNPSELVWSAILGCFCDWRNSYKQTSVQYEQKAAMC